MNWKLVPLEPTPEMLVRGQEQYVLGHKAFLKDCAGVEDIYKTMLEAAPAAPVELEPIAHITGVYSGRFVCSPINRAMILPANMALCSMADAAAVIAKLTQERDEWIACHARVWKRLQLAHKAIEAMRVAGGSVEFQVAFDAAKGLVIGSELISEPLANPLANHEETSDCHGPDWTDRDGEYLK